MGILCAVLTVFIIVLVVRAVLSWFPIRPGTGWAQANRIVFDLTEWALRPMRQIIPPVGVIDLSFMVLFFALLLLRAFVC